MCVTYLWCLFIKAILKQGSSECNRLGGEGTLLSMML